MPDGVPLLIAIVLLLLLSAFFSSTETAYSCANRVKLRAMASNGNKRAKKVLNLAEENFDKLISTILVGNNIVNITATTLSTLFFAMIILNPEISSLVSTIVTTIVVLIFGEITPKFIAKTYPEKFAILFYPLVKFFYYVLIPFNYAFSGWKWILSKVFRLKRDDIVTEDEIMTVVEEAEEDGTLDSAETQMIRQVIEFDDVEVGDILVPRVNMVAVDFESSMDEIKNTFINEGYSRLPVYKDTIDTIIGTIHEKDFYKAYLGGKKGIDGIMQKTLYTTEHIKISDLLRQLQKKKVHIAIVLDEYGGTLGLVTMEDILEELVGEIWDEHDEEVNFFNDIGNNQTIVDGNAPVADMFDYFGLIDEDEKFESSTVSGWVIEELEEIPVVGKKLTYKNLEVEVVKSTIKRVLQVKVTCSPVNDEEDDDNDKN